jgi:tetratricopeptide (TPR) repeat protein
MINSVIIFVLFLMLWAYHRKSVFFYNREFLKVKEGFELLDAKKYDDALIFFDNLLKFDPNNVMGWCGKADSHLCLNNDEEALKSVNNALNIKLSFKKFLIKKIIDSMRNYNKGLVLFGLKNYDETLKYAEIALKFSKNNIGAWNLKGAALVELGQYEESIKYFDNAIKKSTTKLNKVIFSSNKSEALRKLGRYPEAMDCIDKALKIDPESSFIKIWIEEGLVLESLGKHEEAIESYDIIQEIYSEQNPWELQAALNDSDRDLERNMEDTDFWFNRAIILEKLGKNKESHKCIDKTLEINPKFEPAVKIKNKILSNNQKQLDQPL